MALVFCGTNVYYYQSFRSGVRVTSRYVGCGGLAEACASVDAYGRARDARQRATHRRKLAALDARLRDGLARTRQLWLSDREAAGAADAVLAEWYERVEAVFYRTMYAAGYHQHKRTWRRQRMNSQERSAAEKRVQEIWDRIAAGDPEEYQFVKAAFRGAPEENIRAWGGDLPERVVEGFIDRLAGSHLCKREAITRKLTKVQADLEGEDPSPPVRLLAERAAVCWLASYEADLTAQKFDAFAGERSAEYFDRRRERALRQFLRAVKALEVVRRLAVPVKRPQVSFGGRLGVAVVAAERN